MLHIILLILKILGFLVLGIIALMLLAVILVLLCPLTYRAELSADNSLDSLRAKVRFHWFWQLIAGEFSYEASSASWHLRAAWKKSGSDAGEVHSSEMAGGNSKAKGKTEDKATDERPPDERTRHTAQESWEESGKATSAGAVSEDAETPVRQDESDKTHRKKKSRSSGRSVNERIRQFWGKIKYTFHGICDKIKTLKKKKERLATFVRSEIHQAAFVRLIREIKRLIKALRPKKVLIDLEYGFSDPALTGYTLAGVSLVCPLIGPDVQITPDFEQKVFRGSLSVEGKIRLLHGLVFAWNMFLDKNVRITFRHVRKFRL